MRLKHLIFLCALSFSSVLNADNVISDDQIISQSLCVGVDCSDGEEFSYDTVRLRENNLRINFYDTSSSASFPSNDWRIIINDSNNGGANYFAIEDATQAKQRFYIATDGSIKMGANLGDTFTLSPSGDLSIQGTLTDSSDKNLKENIVMIQGDDILKKIETLPISTWNYKANVSKTRHIGAMAQDFYHSFGFGPDERHIAPKDAAFIAMVGVQELQKSLQEKDKEIQKLQAQVKELEALQVSIKQLESLVKLMIKENPEQQLSLAEH